MRISKLLEKLSMNWRDKAMGRLLREWLLGRFWAWDPLIFVPSLSHLCPVCVPRSDKYLGRLATGKIVSGIVEVGKSLKCLGRMGSTDGQKEAPPQKVSELFVTRGVTREPLRSSAGAGDIVTVAGVE